MKIFPDYDKEYKRDETAVAVGTVVIGIVFMVASVGAFLWAESSFLAVSEGTRRTVQVLALICGPLGIGVFLQGVFNLAVALTIGPERFIGACVALGAIGMIYVWLFE